MAVLTEKALVKVSAKVLGFVCNSIVTNYALIAIPFPLQGMQVRFFISHLLGTLISRHVGLH